ncbi:MAG: class I SAM-dependent methyltransferase [Candidatus ainarchaeum sp.]|nr:class I SAM-dependent methyltransferase [Candidatus ainarchaeum sp.]
MKKAQTISIYKMPPEIYNIYMSTKIEARNFQEVYNQIKKTLDKKNTIKILDLCCGTGIFFRNWLSQKRNICYIGVDINKDFLAFARKKITSSRVAFIESDASKAKLGKKFDIVLATSAYHHIEDSGKGKFLENAKRHLDENGILVIYEKLIAEFNSKIEAAKAGTNFYAERILDMMGEEKLNQMQLFALYNELYLTAVRKEEYKVPYNRIISDLQKTGFNVLKEIKLWPKNNKFVDPKVGDFVFVCKKA